MAKHRPRPIDASAAERLLAGGGGPEPVAEVLRQASAPVTPGELAGEDAAAVAFRMARLYGDRTPPAAKAVTWGRRLLTVKAAAIGVAVLTAGGVALAAGAGVLPNPLQVDSPPGSSSDSPTSFAARSDSRGPSSSAGSVSPAAALNGLCTAYLAHLAANPGKVWENPAFATLVTVAGSAEKVEPYCTALVAGGPSATPTPPHGPPTDRPTPTPKPKKT